MMISVAGGCGSLMKKKYFAIFCNQAPKIEISTITIMRGFFLMFTQGWLPRLESEPLKKDFANF